MRSKIITTVIAVTIVGPFAWVATADAVSIKQTKKQHTDRIQQLSVESEKLDTEIVEVKQTKQQTIEAVKQLEKEKNDAISERQKLEAELGAN